MLADTVILIFTHIGATPEDKLYTLFPKFWEDNEQ